MRLGIALKMTKTNVSGERSEHVSNVILSGLLQVPGAFPGNTVWAELIYFSAECPFSGDSWGICMFLGREEGVFWAQDKNKTTYLSAFFFPSPFFNPLGRFYYLSCVQWAGIFHFIHHSRPAAVIPKVTQDELLLAPKQRIFSFSVLTMCVRALLRLHPKFAVRGLWCQVLERRSNVSEVTYGLDTWGLDFMISLGPF